MVAGESFCNYRLVNEVQQITEYKINHDIREQCGLYINVLCVSVHPHKFALSFQAVLCYRANLIILSVCVHISCLSTVFIPYT